ncbi:MAG TPA: dihydroneopterin aldolase [Opitutaceae bacterium]|jgi:dihydroneopterin aldolase|nr:dihydroneopterin aldolase [Opitutaceae bacterium]
MTGRIHLKNMAFYGYHGHHPEENALGQRFLVDLVLEADVEEAARTDSLAAAVDYVRVYAICRKVVEQQKVKLLETLGARIIDAILRECPTVDRVEILIKKPAAPIPGTLDYVAFEAGRNRAARPGQ